MVRHQLCKLATKVTARSSRVGSTVVVAEWFMHLIVDQVYVGSIPTDHLKKELNMIVDVNKELQKMRIGSYSLFVDRENKKIIVHCKKQFQNFNFMNFEVVCNKSLHSFAIDDF